MLMMQRCNALCALLLALGLASTASAWWKDEDTKTRGDVSSRHYTTLPRATRTLPAVLAHCRPLPVQATPRATPCVLRVSSPALRHGC